jgi:serine/threonine protein kinase
MEELPPLFGPGQRLGRFELLRRLAVGGMAEVYLAYAVGPGDFRKVVAIKRLLPQHALDPQLLRMFLDEARLMARLSHPNIPHVTDVDDGKGVGVPFFVMEYVHGTDLRGVLNAAAGALPLEQALTIACATAAGLHHAHEQRGSGGQPLEIVHRDISPSNVLISFDGGVKVTDFGVAKWNEQKSFTHQGQLKGKFAHMSPEQCRGEALDRRSDVFALGTLLYEMTTGEPPFVAESEYELLTQIVSQDALPPPKTGTAYPPDLEAILMRSLKRSRDDRYPTTQHLQLDLEAFAREHRLVVSPVALGGYLETLFGARVTEWREALKSGRSLVEHLEQKSGPVATRGPARATDRTATDTFAMDPSAAAGAKPGLSPRNSPSSSGLTGGRGKIRWGRAAAVAAAGGGALALLLVATELTSRWQRASTPPTLAPGRVVGTDPTGTGTRAAKVAPAVAAPTRTSNTPATAQDQDARLDPTPTPVATAALDVESINAKQATKGKRERTARPTTKAVPDRRASNPAALAARVEDANRIDPVGVRAQPTPAPETELKVRTPQTPTVPTDPAAASPARVKVWDPDSPVPP